MTTTTTTTTTTTSMKPLKVFSNFPLPNESVEYFHRICPNVQLTMWPQKCDREIILANVRGCFGFITTSIYSIDKELLDAAGPELKIISSFSVGLEHIDTEECFKRGIKVGYIKNVGADILGEFTLGLMLSVSRRITESVMKTKGKNWDFYDEKNLLEWYKGKTNEMKSSFIRIFEYLKALKNSIVGIYGLGNIGCDLARRLKNSFDVKHIIYHNRQTNPNADVLGCERVSFDELLERSDFLVCLASVNKENTRIFNRTAFDKMKPNSIFINASRGVLVDADDLYDALKNGGRLCAAGLDVTHPEPLPGDHKLHELDNCIITPHIGWSEWALTIEKANICFQNIHAVLNNAHSEFLL